MFRFKALLEENMERLARIISEEHGKVFSDAVGELTRGLEVVEFACGIRICKRVNTLRTSAPASTATR
jgi:malonate-semialdehyde dehydrogenase (acetylating)/methylmalonate-semialdehyde dehydrogenase